MISSGIKRGLAATAISAMALTGLPALVTSASANPVNAQVGDGQVYLYNSDATPVSTRPDGTDSKITLQAAAGSNIPSITFQYRLSTDGPNDPFTDIQTVATRNDDGSFTYDWTPDAAIVGLNVTLRATGTITGQAIANNSDSPNVTIVPANGASPTTHLTAGTDKGVFDQPYTDAGQSRQTVILTGTSSDASPTTLALATPGGFPATAPVTPTVATGATTGTYAGILNIDGQYDFSGTPDEAVFAAGVNGPAGTQDYEGYTLYNQEINKVVANAVPNPTPTGKPSTVTVTVTDQNGAPIAGARVVPSPTNGPAAAAQFTDASGQTTFQQGLASGATTYYADATNAPGFQPAAGDKQSDPVTVTEFNPAVTSLEGSSVDGPAFDRTEFNSGDLFVQAVDQNGDPIDVPDGQDLSYYYVVTPFDGSAPVRVPIDPANPSTVTMDNNGKFLLPLPSNVSGSYEYFAGLTDDPTTPANDALAPTSVLKVKIGEASVKFAGPNPETANAGADLTVNGSLVLEDGTGLSGRSVDLDYTQGRAGTDPTPDANIVQATPGTVGPTKTVTTGANGGFSVVIDDKSENPQESEVGGLLNAVSVSTGAFSGATAGNGPGDKGVDFSTVTPPVGSTITIDAITDTNNGKPGVATPVANATVDTNPLNNTADPITGQQVVLTLPADSNAFFTDGTYTPDARQGDQVGNLTSLGKSIIRSTDANGQVQFRVGIKRDAGFDDDGLVEAIVTATAGPASDTEDVDFSSANPLNGGDVQIVASPNGEQQGPIDPAKVNQSVAFDAFVTDQFGNRVGNEIVTITQDGDDATIGGTDERVGQAGFQTRADFDATGDFTITSAEDDTVNVTGRWVAPTQTFGAGPAFNPVNGTTVLTDTTTQVFAGQNLNAAAVTLTGNPEVSATVNSPVTETLTAIDSFGKPIKNLDVTFTRTGPGAVTDVVTRTTNADGVARYVFSSTTAGTATVRADVTDGNVVVTRTDTVNFTTDGNPGGTPVANSFAIVQSPDGTQSVGTAVTETVTVLDQNGDGFAGASVNFVRSGPDGQTQSSTRTTNAAGQATFTFVGTAAGTATITAVIDYGTGTNTVSDDVTFVNGPVKKKTIKAVLHAKNFDNVGRRVDRLHVFTNPDAPIAKVIFYKKKDGQLKRIATGRTGPKGNATEKVIDRNGNRVTTYFALVKSTDTTNSARTNRSRTR